MNEKHKRYNMLVSLSGVLSDLELDQAAKIVKSIHDEPIPEIIDKLSLLERTVSSSEAHRAIAMGKQAIAGKTDGKEFTEYCLKRLGLR